MKGQNAGPFVGFDVYSSVPSSFEVKANSKHGPRVHASRTYGSQGIITRPL